MHAAFRGAGGARGLADGLAGVGRRRVRAGVLLAVCKHGFAPKLGVFGRGMGDRQQLSNGQGLAKETHCLEATAVDHRSPGTDI